MKPIKWEANLTNKLENALVSLDQDNGNYQATLAFYIPGINFPNHLPQWNIYCQDQIISREFTSFWGLIRDTLFEYKPCIKLTYGNSINCFTSVGKLTSFIASDDLTAVVDKSDHKIYYLHLTIILDSDEYLPKTINNIEINIGDYLCVSDIPGYLIKQNENTRISGKRIVK